jgi:hypothetical protein
MRVRANWKSAARAPLLAVATLIACHLLFLPSEGRINLWRHAPNTYENGGRETNTPPDHPSQARQQAHKLYPVDEASKDPSFKAFRDALIDAVKRRDIQFILNAIAPDILNDFGGGNGIEEFKATWKLTRVSESRLWTELDAVLSMGGTFQTEGGKKSFWAPYVYSAWPDDFDCGEEAQCYAITAENVNVRREPASNAPIVASLSYDIVRGKSEDPASVKLHQGWTLITVPGGSTGWVATKYTRSQLDYRAGFTKVKGRWLMTALIAGD